MSTYKDNGGDPEGVKKRDYLKQQHQLRTMTKCSTVLSADDMIENLLSKKEIFKMKKEPNPPKSPQTVQANYPAWLSPGQEPALYKRVWEIVVTPGGFADTPKLTNLLLTSRLPTDVLGYIWSLSNISLAPALSQIETYTSLALIALVQNGYSFTSAAVLNTLKEAPLPKLDFPLVDGLKSPVTPPSLFQPVCSVQPLVSQPSPSSLSLIPEIDQIFPVANLTKTNSVDNSTKNEKIQSSPSTSLPSLSQELSLLDLDSSPPSTSKKTTTTTSVKTSPKSILDKENSIDFSEKIITPNSKNDLISEFSPTASKNKVSSAILSNSPLSLLDSEETTEGTRDTVMDDFFGDFQSVDLPDKKIILTNDDVEYDDFKSADFTPLTVLEVKEKPPEIVNPVLEMKAPEPLKEEEKSGVEDLFPRCVLKPGEESGESLTKSEDKYSALRGLMGGESQETDEFGDFLAAAPPAPLPVSQPPSSLPLPLVINQAGIQEKSLEACLEILEEAVRIFESIDKEEILNDVIHDPRGIQYLEELIEVERIALRIRSNLDKECLSSRLEKASVSLDHLLKPHRNAFLAEENGPKCGICLCDRGPAYVKYGLNNFHAPCANLYLHKVDSSLPIAPIM